MQYPNWRGGTHFNSGNSHQPTLFVVSRDGSKCLCVDERSQFAFGTFGPDHRLFTMDNWIGGLGGGLRGTAVSDREVDWGGNKWLKTAADGTASYPWRLGVFLNRGDQAQPTLFVVSRDLHSCLVIDEHDNAAIGTFRDDRRTFDVHDWPNPGDITTGTAVSPNRVNWHNNFWVADASPPPAPPDDNWWCVTIVRYVGSAPIATVHRESFHGTGPAAILRGIQLAREGQAVGIDLRPIVTHGRC